MDRNGSLPTSDNYMLPDADPERHTPRAAAATDSLSRSRCALCLEFRAVGGVVTLDTNRAALWIWICQDCRDALRSDADDGVEGG